MTRTSSPSWASSGARPGLTPETHWGHRCVVFPGTAEDELPARPISAGRQRRLYGEMRYNMAAVRWLQPLDWKSYTAYVDYLDALSTEPECAPDVDVRELPLDCEEFAATPRASCTRSSTSGGSTR